MPGKIIINPLDKEIRDEIKDEIKTVIADNDNEAIRANKEGEADEEVKEKIEEEVKESFQDEDVPVEPVVGNDGVEVGGEG